MKPRIFLGSSGKQANLLQALTIGLEGVAQVEAWTTVFNPGVGTLERLVELTHEVDFAAFIFAQDDWTSIGAPSPDASQASPRDNVVFEAGLFGGALGMRRTFILHANGAKLPTDLLGLTCVRYDGSTADAEIESISQKIRNAIENEGRAKRIEGLWWQFSLTERTEHEPSAVSILKISRDRGGALEVNGRAWQEDGKLSSRYWSEATKEKPDSSGLLYFWKGERPLAADAPRLEGTAEVTLESAERASGYWTTRSDRDPLLNYRTSGIYVRADPDDLAVLDGNDIEKRAALVAERMRRWQALRNG
ncbi:MAG: TIR domain-containing protein [Pyrinomonadaceae bacterium]